MSDLKINFGQIKQFKSNSKTRNGSKVKGDNMQGTVIKGKGAVHGGIIASLAMVIGALFMLKKHQSKYAGNFVDSFQKTVDETPLAEKVLKEEQQQACELIKKQQAQLNKLYDSVMDNTKK